MRSLCLLSLVALGCSGTPAPTMTTSFPAPPAGQGIQISAGPYTLDAHAEKYFCYTQTVQSDVAATEVDVHAGQSVHHLAVFRTTSPEPDGFSECPSLIKTSWIPLYGGGRSTPGLTLPEGAGFKFAAGTQILVQLHLVNATDQPVTDTTLVNLLFAADPSSVTPAGIFALGNLSFDIPAGATNYPVVGQCKVAHKTPMNVFALFPHMHLLGTSIEFDYGTSEANAQMVYQVNPWTFGDQPMKTMQMTVNPGDFLRATCTYDNPGASDVKYGESTFDEMCFVILFYTPFEQLDGCVM